MDIKELLSGIAVVIDDALKKEKDEGNGDRIFDIIDKIKEQDIPLYMESEIPSDKTCDSLLRSASFVLLDWKLWEAVGDTLEKKKIEENIEFLDRAKRHFTPVFILTNENIDDIEQHLDCCKFYDKKDSRKNFIFIEDKHRMNIDNVFNPIKEWMSTNASVYTLKAWEQAFYKAKEDFFCSMYEKSPSWPIVFWSSYKEDGVEPSSLIANLINNNVLARMNNSIFKESVLNREQGETDREQNNIDPQDVKSVLAGSIFIPEENLSKDEIRAGDIFKKKRNKYLINIRADCDCIPRDETSLDDIALLCIEGSSVNPKKVYDLERVWQSIVFGIDKKTVQFDFRKFISIKYGNVCCKRVGRLNHPYITRVQQRFAFYLQRQGLPRIPEEVIN